MDTRNLDFTFDMANADRQVLLEKSAKGLDSLSSHLSSTAPTRTETLEGDFVRAFADDVVEFAGFPVVYKITNEDFEAHNVKPPVRFQQLTQTNNLYWLHFPIALFPRQNWAFNLLEVKVEFNPNDLVPHARPKAYQILPDKKFQTMLEMKEHLEIGIDENFEFSVETGALLGQTTLELPELEAALSAKGTASIGVVVGPFLYRIVRARIDHTPTGMEKVFWRLDGAELFQTEVPALIVVAQIPKETEEVNIAAQMQAYRNYSYLSADVRNFIRELPRVYRNFLAAGVPIRSEAAWDITPRL